ncbi:MAG: ABC transporter permease, partial [Verrucomicrobiota bacterium]
HGTAASRISHLNMLAFILRRFLSLLGVLVCVVTITFLLIRLATGGPLSAEREIPEAVRQALLEKYQLDGSIWSQYGRYLKSVLQGDLRLSLQYQNRSVNEILANSLPVSFTLGGMAFLIATIGGVFLGTIAAIWKNTWIDHGAMIAALLSISTPAFVTGPLLILVFALSLSWFPVGGWFTLKSMILPSFVLAAPYLAYIARLLRTSMLDVLKKDFVRTAYAKGLHPAKVTSKHVLKCAILPVITFLGPLAANLLTGSIVVESIFNIPGAGAFFVKSIASRDGFLLCGVVVVYCTLLVVFNFIVDLLYVLIDRRIKLYGS